MPRNRFPFPVGVSRKINLVRLFDLFAKLCENISLTPDRNIFRLKIMLYIDTKLAFGRSRTCPWDAITT